MGFCLLNNVAVVAAELRARGERVAIVDIDAHHGNGTQEIFYEDPDVLYVSFHEWPLYPGTGRHDEIGAGAGVRCDVQRARCPRARPATCTCAAWTRSSLRCSTRFAPDWLLISAGFDAHRDDPITGLGLSAADYAAARRPGSSTRAARAGRHVPRGRLLAAGTPRLGRGVDPGARRRAPTVPEGEEPTSGGPGDRVVDRRGRALAAAPHRLIRAWRPGPRRDPVGSGQTSLQAPPRTPIPQMARQPLGRPDAREDVAVLDLDQVLREAVERGASDVHIKVGSPPHIRLDGELITVSDEQVQAADTERVAFAVMPKIRAEEFIATNEADFAYALNGVGPLPRQRVPPARLGGDGAAAHPPGHPADGGARPPARVPRLAEEKRGLVLVTGPTGSGKTTTLAAMIDHINETQARHIVTIEDPIEVLHPDKHSIINQREVGADTTDFLGALKRALRQDPDVILIGEMRDPETVWAALSAAETGHLCSRRCTRWARPRPSTASSTSSRRTSSSRCACRSPVR